jgi:ParB family transcriptional regulator, chromosome partitioning protein
MIVDGERRYRAAGLLHIDRLPCWIQSLDGRDVLIDQVIHNWQRADLRPCETADALARLRDEFGMSGKDISATTGKPKSEVSKLIAIHDRVIPEVQERARTDERAKLSKRHLYSISKLPSDQQADVADQIRQGGYSAIQTEKLVSKKRTRSGCRGLDARQRRFHTSTANVAMTFRRATVSDRDVMEVLDEIRAMLG